MSVRRAASHIMFVQLTRFVLATVGALAGLSVRGSIDWTQQYGYPEYTVIILFVILGASIGFILGGILGREIQHGYLNIEDHLRGMSVVDLGLGIVGLLLGLVVALILSTPIRTLQPPSLALLAQGGMYVVLGYVGVRTAMIKRRDVARLFSRFIPAAEEVKGASLKLLDTSAIIDGRFSDLLRVGFVEGPVRVPSFVLSELQTLADSADEIRRARGRRGLDLLATLHGGDHPVETFSMDYPDVPDVDSKLVRLAADSGGTVVTVDYNLTQVARVQGVGVLNINDLAAALRPSHLPGETLRLHVARDGKEPDQGVGHLADGTMVVVQNGRDKVGQDADVVITSVLQTSGGRMIFARPRSGA